MHVTVWPDSDIGASPGERPKVDCWKVDDAPLALWYYNWINLECRNKYTFDGDAAAIQAIAEAIDAGAANDVYHMYLAEFLMSRGIEKMASAREALEKVSDKAGWLYLSRLGELERLLGNYEAALGHFTKCRAIVKNGCYARTRMIHCYLELGKSAEAVALVTELAADAKKGATWLGNRKKSGGAGEPVTDEAKTSAAQIDFMVPFCNWTANIDRAGAFETMKTVWQSASGVSGWPDLGDDSRVEQFTKMPIHFGVFWFHTFFFGGGKMAEDILSDEFMSLPREIVVIAKKKNLWIHEVYCSWQYFAFTWSMAHPSPSSVNLEFDIYFSMTNEVKHHGITFAEKSVGLAVATLHSAYCMICDSMSCMRAYNSLIKMGEMSPHWLIKFKAFFYAACAMAKQDETTGIEVLSAESPLKPSSPGEVANSLSLSMVLTSTLASLPEASLYDDDPDGTSETVKNTRETLLTCLRKAPTNPYLLHSFAEVLLMDGRPRVALVLYQEVCRRYGYDCFKKRPAPATRMMACAFFCGERSFYPAVVRHFRLTGKKIWGYSSTWQEMAAKYEKLYEDYEESIEDEDKKKHKTKPKKDNMTARFLALKKSNEDAFSINDVAEKLEEMEEMGLSTGTGSVSFLQGVFANAMMRLGMFYDMNKANLITQISSITSSRSCAYAWTAFMIINREATVPQYKTLAENLWKRDKKNPFGNIAMGWALHHVKSKRKNVDKNVAEAQLYLDEYVDNEKMDVFDAYLCSALGGALLAVLKEDPSPFYDYCDKFEKGRCIPGLVLRTAITGPAEASYVKTFAPIAKALKGYWYKDGADDKVKALAEAAGISEDDPLIGLARAAVKTCKAIPQFAFDVDWIAANMDSPPFSCPFPARMTDVKGQNSRTGELIEVADLLPLQDVEAAEVSGKFTFPANYLEEPADDEDEKKDDLSAADPVEPVAAAPAPADEAPAPVEEKKEDAPEAATAAPAESVGDGAAVADSGAAAPPPPVEEKKEEPAKPAVTSAPAASAAPAAAKKPDPVPKAAAPAASKAPVAAAPSRYGASAPTAPPVEVVARPLEVVEKPPGLMEQLTGHEDEVKEIARYVASQERRLRAMRRERRSDVLRWTPDQVGDFILCMPFYGGFPEYYDYCIRKRGINGATFFNTTDVASVRGWGIDFLPHAMRIMSEILKFRHR